MLVNISLVANFCKSYRLQPVLVIIHTHTLCQDRDYRYKLIQFKHVHYNPIKFSFSNKVVSIWNSLPDYVVSACSCS